MTAAARIALVSGGNRGIGYEICRQLAKHGLTVVLAAREAGKGKAAAKALLDEGLPGPPNRWPRRRDLDLPGPY